jgi:hypothetical protein
MQGNLTAPLWQHAVKWGDVLFEVAVLSASQCKAPQNWHLTFIAPLECFGTAQSWMEGSHAILYNFLGRRGGGGGGGSNRVNKTQDKDTTRWEKRERFYSMMDQLL